MNDQMIRDLEKAIRETPEGVKLTIKDTTDAVDAQDLEHQQDNFNRLLMIEVSNKSERLRHRAQMMRQRASEFDRLADDADKQCQTAMKQNLSLVTLTAEIEELLAAHAHIEPRRVG